MPRIRTDQPSSGKPLLLFIPTTTNSGFVPSSWTTIAEAPDFSIPASGDDETTVDPADNGRELRGGEVFFESPLVATNTTATTRWVELQVKLQGNSGQEVPVTAQVPVPGGETVYLPVQGARILRLIARTLATSLTSANNGEQYQILIAGNTSFTLIGAANNNVGTLFTKSGSTGTGTGEVILAGAGGRLQVRAEVNNAIKVIGSAVELEALDHAPDTEAP